MKETKGKTPLYIPTVVVSELLNPKTECVWAVTYHKILDSGNIFNDVFDTVKSFSEVNKVREFGIKKYGDPDNWLTVPVHEYVSAFWRHIDKMLSGEKFAEDSGLTHKAHALCNAVFILWHELMGNTEKEQEA